MKGTGTVLLPPRDLVVPGYCEEHVDLHFSTMQAFAFRTLLDALKKKHAHLSSGRPVHSTADVVRWFADRVGDGYGLTGVELSRVGTRAVPTDKDSVSTLGKGGR